MLEKARHTELLLYDPLRQITVQVCQKEEEREMRAGHSSSGEVENCFGKNRHERDRAIGDCTLSPPCLLAQA